MNLKGTMLTSLCAQTRRVGHRATAIPETMRAIPETMRVIPETMRAWEIHRYGSNEVLSMAEHASLPVLKSSSEVLVRVHAASINALDVKMRGGYGSNMINIMRRQQNRMAAGNSEFPLTLGRDCSGVVVRTGPEVHKFTPGDEVWGVISPFRQGSHAEYVVAAQSELAHKPKQLDFIEAAAFPYIGVTAWSALCTIGGLSPTKAKNLRVLVHGASGGIGTFVVQLLRAWGAEVTAVCSTNAVRLVSDLGADHVIDYRSGDLLHLLRSIKGFDLAIDAVGTDLTRRVSMETLKPWSDSKYINVVTPLLRNADDYGTALGTAKSLLDLGLNLAQGLTRGIGVRWAYYIPNGEVLSHLTELIVQKKVRPVIDRVYGLDDLPHAYSRLEAREHMGKLLLSIRSDTQDKAPNVVDKER